MNWPPEYHSLRGEADELADTLCAQESDLEESAIVVCMGRLGAPCGVLLGFYCSAGHKSTFNPVPSLEVATLWTHSEPHCHCGRAVNTRKQSHSLCRSCEVATYAAEGLVMA